jgi:hypothetical protein
MLTTAGDLPPILVKILFARGFVPGTSEFTAFLEPKGPTAAVIEQAIGGMLGAVAVLEAALTQGAAVGVITDTDPDGLCAGLMLCEAIQALGGRAVHRFAWGQSESLVRSEDLATPSLPRRSFTKRDCDLSSQIITHRGVAEAARFFFPTLMQ